MQYPKNLFRHGLFILGVGAMSMRGVAQNLPFDDPNSPRLQANAPVAPPPAAGTNQSSFSNGDSYSQNQWKSLATPENSAGQTAHSLPPANDPPQAGSAPIGGALSSSKARIKDEYGPQTGWGLRTSAGVAIQQSLTASTAYGNGHLFYNFQPGARLDLETFYNVTNGFYFGLEGAFIYNQISSVQQTGYGQAPVSYISGDSNLGYAAFYQVPILLNIRFQIPNTGRFRGYCTGGFGGVWDCLASSSFLGTQTEEQWNYAFQLGAGFQYNLLPGLDLDTSFKTFITPNPLLFSDGTSQVKTSYSYALEIGLAYRF